MSISRTSFKPKMSRPWEMTNRMASSHDRNKNSANENMDAVEACGQIECSSINGIGNGETAIFVFYQLK